MENKGDKFEELVFAVTDYRTADGKKGDYTRLSLRTKEGREYEAVYWDGVMPESEFGKGKIVILGGIVDVYKDSVQLKIKTFRAGDNSAAMEFLPRVPKDEHRYNLEVIGEALKKIKHRGLHEFSRFCLKKWGKQFSNGTGAIKNHHALVGGYVKHVAEMTLVAERLIELYIGKQIGSEWLNPATAELLGKQAGRQLDADLVRAALPLHDWGKMEEYATEGAAFIVTRPGELLSHPGITPWRLAELRIEYHAELEKEDKEDPKDDLREWFIDDDLFVELLHVIGAHHGQVRFNACSAPKTVAAMIVHIADYTSCFMDVAAQQCYGEGERGTFTDDRFPNPDYFKKLMRS